MLLFVSVSPSFPLPYRIDRTSTPSDPRTSPYLPSGPPGTLPQRTIIQRTPPMKRQTVEHEGYLCHAYNQDGLGAIAVCTQDYPSRAAFCVLNDIIEKFTHQVGSKRSTTREGRNSST